MRGLVYVLFTGYKNAFKEMLHNPAKLVLYLFLVVMLAFVLISPRGHEVAGRPLAEVYAMVLALFTMVFVMNSKSGFRTGASFYRMSDVNLLFPAPVPPKLILFYGLLKQMGTSLLVGFFLLFQFSWLHNAYGIGFGILFAIFFCYCGVVFCAQVTSLAIYAFTSGDEKRKRVVQGIFYGFYALVIVYLLFPLLSRGLSLEALVAAVSDPLLSYLPVSGWFTAVVNGIAAGSAGMLAAGLGGVAAYVLALILLILKMRADFYEDVLLATEISFQALSGAKEGRMPESTVTNVKVGKTGLGKGWGAAAFYYKHRLENRRSRFLLVDKTTWIFILACWAFGFFVRDGGIMGIFVFTVYMQIFSVATGRWMRELLQPYVYLLPEKPFRKLVMIFGELIYRIFVESLLIFVPLGLLLASPAWEIAGAIVARFSFGLLFVAGNVLVERVFGQIQSKIVTVPLYFITLLVLSAPGVAGGFLLLHFFPTAGLALVFLALFLWNVPLSLLLFFLCRNMLHIAELNFRS